MQHLVPISQLIFTLYKCSGTLFSKRGDCHLVCCGFMCRFCSPFCRPSAEKQEVAHGHKSMMHIRKRESRDKIFANATRSNLVPFAFREASELPSHRGNLDFSFSSGGMLIIHWTDLLPSWGSKFKGLLVC